ncbi:hypothetical protein JCM8547_001860 [Rhodosporidiobolus lusitaniae]
MARSSKEWRRSSLSLPSSPPLSKQRRRPRFAIAITCALSLLIVLYLSFASPSSTSDPPSSPVRNFAHAQLAKWHDGAHPNFDFDAHAEQQEETEHAEGDEEDSHGEDEEEDAGAAGYEEESAEGALDEGEGGEGAGEGSKASTRLHDGSSSSGKTAAQPFLPFTCDPCSSASLSSSLPSPTCAKYRSSTLSSASSSPLHPSILDHSVLFPGTGEEIRRVLKRAMKSSLYGAKRAREGLEHDAKKWEDEEPFRILVLGGSVSNCRGVDPNTACWHSHVLRWFQKSFPMEGDRDLVPDVPSLLFPSPSSLSGPLRLDDFKKPAKRSLPPSPSSAHPAPSSPSSSPSSLSKRSTGKTKKKTKSKKVKAGSTSRRRPSTKLIQGSKSATGSAFFAYCFDEEMTLRRKNVDWGLGPDFILVESGVNDVWPGGEHATRDFEKLLRRLRSMPSKPAVIALEAASLLLASTTAATANAEYDHLPAAHFYDVPILSAKNALFGPTPGLLSSSSTSAPLKIEDLFLPDLHHPNERGHELLADVLLSYLEQQACLAQSEVLAAADERASSSPTSSNQVDPALDIPRRKDEHVRPLPRRSLFTPFPHGKGSKKVQDEEWELPESRCIQVGNLKTTVEPVRNNGWEKLAWARDKQYLVADSSGASVTYRIEIGKGGTVLADWLHSRFYDLGDVSVYLNNDRSSAVQLAGYWDLGWSIGVPTEIFRDVAPGEHELTFEVLPASQSSHPGKKTNFRLIGIVST